MPIQAGSLIAPENPGTPNRALDFAHVEWASPDGQVYPLTNPELGYWLASMDGIGSAPISISVDIKPRGGSRVRSIRRNARIITLGLAVAEGVPLLFRDSWRRLEDAITRTTEDGPGELVMRYSDGQERRIPAYYEAGFERGQGDNWTWAVAPVQFYCPDGLWYDPRPVVVTKTFQSAGTSFFEPWPRVSPGNSVGDTTLTNSGQVPTGPSWRVDGPFSGFSATIYPGDPDRELSFELEPDTPLTLGQYLLVTTDPDTVTDHTGADRLDALVIPGSTLWSVPRGTVPVNFTLTDPSDGAGVTITTRRWYKLP